jgi:hypothetical protein
MATASAETMIMVASCDNKQAQQRKTKKGTS